MITVTAGPCTVNAVTLVLGAIQVISGITGTGAGTHKVSCAAEAQGLRGYLGEGDACNVPSETQCDHIGHFPVVKVFISIVVDSGEEGNMESN